MDKKTCEDIAAYTHGFMGDSAHDESHVYRVLYAALEIAQDERKVDKEVLIAACLLHDIGRQLENEDPALCHAKEGSKMAYAFLRKYGWPQTKAAHVRDAIAAHRFRSDAVPESLEAKILFDADKLDATGALGIARTLVFEGILKEPLYNINENNQVLDGSADKEISFFQEYHYKLKHLYGQFYTDKGKALAKERQKASMDFYEALLSEVQGLYVNGEGLLQECIA